MTDVQTEIDIIDATVGKNGFNPLNAILNDWDISFGISGEVLVYLLKFSMDINSDVPLRFYEDKIFSNFKSPDNIRYAQIIIPSGDVLDYMPGINESDNKNKVDNKIDIVSILSKEEYNDQLNAVMEGIDSFDMYDIDPEETYEEYVVRQNAIIAEKNRYIYQDINNKIFKIAYFNAKSVFKDIERLVDKDDIIVVRIDTISKNKRIEFHVKCSIIHAQLIQPTDNMLKELDRLPKIIDRVRNDMEIKKAIIVIEPLTFALMCFKVNNAKLRDIDKRVLFTINKERMLVLSGDRLKGLLFEIVKDPLADTITLRDREIRSKQEERKKKMKKIFGDDGEIDINKEAEKPNDKVINRALGIEVDEPQKIYLSMEFLSPFLLIIRRLFNPIVMEIRTDKPLVLETRAWNNINIMLTIAPRMEQEDD